MTDLPEVLGVDMETHVGVLEELARVTGNLALSHTGETQAKLFEAAAALSRASVLISGYIHIEAGIAGVDSIDKNSATATVPDRDVTPPTQSDSSGLLVGETASDPIVFDADLLSREAALAEPVEVDDRSTNAQLDELEETASQQESIFEASEVRVKQELQRHPEQRYTKENITNILWGLGLVNSEDETAILLSRLEQLDSGFKAEEAGGVTMYWFEPPSDDQPAAINTVTEGSLSEAQEKPAAATTSRKRTQVIAPEDALPLTPEDENRRKHAAWGLSFKIYPDETPAVVLDGELDVKFNQHAACILLYNLAGLEPGTERLDEDMFDWIPQDLLDEIGKPVSKVVGAAIHLIQNRLKGKRKDEHFIIFEAGQHVTVKLIDVLPTNRRRG